MSKPANKKAIGAFVVAGLALTVAAIVVFGSGKFFAKQDGLVAFFKGSVKGLRIGAPVVFRGVTIGEVTDMMILTDRRDHTFEIPVIMKVERDSFRAIDADNEIKDRKQYVQDLIQSGLRAQLQLQSLVTGQLMVNIDFFPDTPVRIVADRSVMAEHELTEIPTIQTPLQKIEQTLEALPIKEMAENISKSLAAIEKIMTSGQLAESLENLNQAAADIRRLVNRVDEKVDPLTEEISRTLKGTQDLLQDLSEEVKPLAVSLRQTSDAAGRLIANVDRQVEPLAGRLDKSLEAVYTTLRRAEKTLVIASGAMEEGAPLRLQVETTFGKLGQAASSIQALADYLKRNPDALIRGKSASGGF
jgi:paraquat-inducible protein B